MTTDSTHFSILERAHMGHTRLKRLFNDFADYVRERFHDDNPPLPGVTVSVDSESDYFEVTFIGRRFQFLYSCYWVDGTSGARGHVEVIEVNGLREPFARAIGGFDFKHNGNTDVDGAGEYAGDKLEMTGGAGTLSIIATFLVLALQVPALKVPTP